MQSLRTFFPAVVAALAFSLSTASGAEGQGVTGSIDGTVSDETGAVLPGVTVTISSLGLLGGEQFRVSEGDGSFRFTALPPGRYAVSFELAGFQRV